MGTGLVHTSLKDVNIDQPKVAGEEGAFTGREPVSDFSGVVAEKQAATHELLFNGFYRSGDALVFDIQKADDRYQKQASVQMPGSRRPE